MKRQSKKLCCWEKKEKILRAIRYQNLWKGKVF